MPDSTQTSLLDEQELVDELATLLSDDQDAREHLVRAGFPRAQMPVFRVPINFWSMVIQAAHDGVPPGVRGIVRTVAASYPQNRVLAQYLGVSVEEMAKDLPPRRTVSKERTLLIVLILTVVVGIAVIVGMRQTKKESARATNTDLSDGPNEPVAVLTGDSTANDVVPSVNSGDETGGQGTTSSTSGPMDVSKPGAHEAPTGSSTNAAARPGQTAPRKRSPPKNNSIPSASCSRKVQQYIRDRLREPPGGGIYQVEIWALHDRIQLQQCEGCPDNVSKGASARLKRIPATKLVSKGSASPCKIRMEWQ